jgi:hypothetical protein
MDAKGFSSSHRLDGTTPRALEVRRHLGTRRATRTRSPLSIGAPRTDDKAAREGESSKKRQPSHVNPLDDDPVERRPVVGRSRIQQLRGIFDEERKRFVAQYNKNTPLFTKKAIEDLANQLSLLKWDSKDARYYIFLLRTDGSRSLPFPSDATPTIFRSAHDSPDDRAPPQLL